MPLFEVPQFVLEMTHSRKKLVVASFFMWPMIHNWFVSMGMLDFALGVPMSLFTLMLLERQRKAWSWPRANPTGRSYFPSVVPTRKGRSRNWLKKG